MSRNSKQNKELFKKATEEAFKDPEFLASLHEKKKSLGDDTSEGGPLFMWTFEQICDRVEAMQPPEPTSI